MDLVKEISPYLLIVCVFLTAINVWLQSREIGRLKARVAELERNSVSDSAEIAKDNEPSEK